MIVIKYIFVVACLMSAFFVNAQAAKTVREDRVWNYEINLERLEGSVICSEYAPGYHFKGSVEKEGKTYMQFLDADDECVALMREEDGKIYLYLAEEWRNLGDEFAPVMVDSSEILLYDFGAKVGDKCTLVSFSYPEMGGLSVGCLLSEATVTDTYTVNVGDEDMRALSLQCGESVYTLVEGVGLDGGMLPFPQSEWTNTGMRMTYARLQTLTDLDGNMLFSGKYFPPYGNTVRTNRVWNYDVKSFLGAAWESTYEVNNFRFIGKKEMIDGNNYAVLVHSDADDVSYLREDGGKVYLYLTDELIANLQDYDATRGREALLYDFTAEPGDTFVSVIFDEAGLGSSAYATVTVKSRGTAIVDGEEVVCQTLEYCPNDNKNAGHIAEAIEGIGISRGRLDRPQCGYLTSGMNYTYSLLRTVTNDKGEVIFDGKDFSDDPSGITTAETVISKDKSWYYISTTYPNSDFHLLYEMKFEGEMEANGKTYHGFVNTSVIEYDKGLDNPGTRLPDDEKLKTSYFREEGDALYVLTSSGCPVVGEMNAAGEYSEELVMDFSLPDGAEFPSGLFCQDDFDEQLYIQYVDMETAEGIQGRRYFELYSLDGEGNKLKYAPIFGEGLGLINGIMPEFNLAWSTSMWDSFLLQVSEGRDILYKADGYEWFDPTKQDPNGVIGVEREKDIISSTADGVVSPNTDIAVFDLSGNRVAEGRGSVSTAGLQPGVYVAKTAGQSLKIVVK